MTFLFLTAILMGASVGVVPGSAGKARAAEVEVSAGVFYRTLSPYGEWVSVGHYGRVWRPSRSYVGSGFRPYATGGHWVHTDYGWSFESDWEWGWATFHYGRWFDDPDYGWVWMPGTTWSPAWVDWRFGGGYIGWAPLPPAGISISFAVHPATWCVVETPNFTSARVAYHVMPSERVRGVLVATAPVRREVSFGGARWNPGPRATAVSAVMHKPIETLHVAPPRAGHLERVRPVAQAPIQRHEVQRQAPVQRHEVQRQEPIQRQEVQRQAPIQRHEVQRQQPTPDRSYQGSLRPPAQQPARPQVKPKRPVAGQPPRDKQHR